MEETIAAIDLTHSEAERLTGRIRRSGADLTEMLREAHDRKAWAVLGYKSWSAYVDGEFTFSRATSYRLLSAPSEQDSLVSGTELSHDETDNSSNGLVVDALDVAERPLDTITPDAVLPKAPAQKSERPDSGALVGDDCPDLAQEEREDAGTDHRADLSDPSPKNPERLPTLRQVANAFVVDLQNTEEGFGEKWTPTQATYVDNRMAREMAGWRAANGIPDQPKDEPPKRRQGTVTTPADRAAAKAAEDIATRRPLVSVPTNPPQRRAHADDCSCYGCRPPKAAKA